MPYPSSTLFPGSGTYPGFPASPSEDGGVSQAGEDSWAVVLCSSAGVAQRLIAPESLTFRRELNRAASVKLTLPLDSADAYSYYEQLAGGLPQVRVYQDRLLRFSGLWAPSTEDSPEGDAPAYATLEFRDPFDLLAHRFTGAAVTFTAVDAGLIAWQLIDATDSNAYLALGEITATKNRDGTYDRAQVAEMIVNLTEVIDGFDFTIAPLDFSVAGALGTFSVQAAKGTDRSAYIIFEHGPDTRGNAATIGRQTGYPVNRATVVGNAITSVAEDTASQALYGVWEAYESRTDISEQATLDDHAESMLQPAPPQAITFTPEPTMPPVPFVDYDIGDTVTLRAVRDSLVIDTTARVTAIEVALDENGVEARHTIETGDQRPKKLADTFREMKRRLSTLEAP